jgi:hypothetical protein
LLDIKRQVEDLERRLKAMPDKINAVLLEREVAGGQSMGESWEDRILIKVRPDWEVFRALLKFSEQHPLYGDIPHVVLRIVRERLEAEGLLPEKKS